jgi:general nucleoside transport system ATP-binding protein
VKITGPSDAIKAGIGMVHQHFMLVGVFSVAENVMLGVENVRNGLLDRSAARKLVRDVSDRYRLPVDPDATVEDLPLGAQQRVEIIKALTRKVDLLILDEPTAVLTPQETDELLEVMHGLRADGKSIVFITHKLREVKAVADRITVIRRGTVVGTATPDASQDELASMMVGRSVQLTVAKAPREPGAAVLTVTGLQVADDRGQLAVNGADLTVRAGEVVGVAGVQGNGQTELVEAIMGLRPVIAGEVSLGDRSLIGMKTSAVLAAGVGYIPEDRSVDGLVKEFSVAEALILDMYRRQPFSSGIALRRPAIGDNARERIAEFDIRTSSPDAAVGTLSGGNQQKVIVAREMSRPLTLLIAAEPTRGVDVGSTEFIHARVVAERDQGKAVLLISSELDEVVALADRIAVMYRGRVLAVVPADTPRERLGLLMAGVTGEAA